MINDYDMIIVKKTSDHGFSVWEIYPNEDNGKRTPVQKFFLEDWDGVKPIDDFINHYDGRCCIEDDYNSVEEIISSFEHKTDIRWCSDLIDFHSTCHYMKPPKIAIFWRI